MNDYLMVLIADASAVFLVMFGVYLKYRRGLATRMFFLSTPVAGIIGYIGFLIGKIGVTPVVLVFTVIPAALLLVVDMIVMYRMVVGRIQSQVTELVSNTTQLSSTATQSASTAAEQSSTVTQVSTTVEEVTQMSKSASEGSQTVVEIAEAARKKGREGIEAVSGAQRIMDRISQVGDVVDTVQQLAEQSNLLAVNAGIEAAKAGEYGRGFAVVAAEVRNLAEQSKAASNQIRDAIILTEEGRQSVNVIDGVLQELGQVLEQTSDEARRISGGAAQQSAGMRQISDAMQNVSQGGHDIASSSKQIEDAVDNLTRIANTLQTFITG